MTARADPSRTSLRPQRGLTLVELMVGLTLGLIMSAVLLLLFADSSAAGRSFARSAAQIENGRYLSELLSEDLRLAGFFGEFNVAGATYSTPDPCSTTPAGWVNATVTIPSAVQGYRAVDPLACLNDRQAGSDAIAVRRLGVRSVAPATLGVGSGQHYVQYSFCIDDAVNLPFVFGADPLGFTLRGRDCSGANMVREYVSRIYYLASCNRCGTGGDTTPTLKRVDLLGNQLRTTALVDGVETLRFEYGFDVDGDGSADVYRTEPDSAGPASLWSNVMAVKVHFITRSLQTTAGQTATAQTFQLGGIGSVTTAADGHTRRAYSLTVRLINPSGAREVQ